MAERIEYFFFSVLNHLARKLAYRSVGRVGSFLGGAVFRLTGFRKAVTFDNISKAFPSMPEKEKRLIALGAYRSYATALMQSLWLGDKPLELLDEIVHPQNPEVMKEAQAKGRGVIFLSAHFGGFEFIINMLRHFFKTPVTTIVQRQRNRRIDAVFDANRSRFGNETVPMGPSARRVIAALHEKRIVAMLGDQSGPKEAVFVDFFGRPAATHRGVAAFSLKTGAPIVMGFFVRREDGTYDLTFERVDLTDLHDYTEDNIMELTRRHTAILERWVRRFPDHWLWMHKRWKHTSYYQALEGERAIA